MTKPSWIGLVAIMLAVAIVSWWLALLLLPFVFIHAILAAKNIKSGWIYFLSDDIAGLVKIGRSKHPPATRVHRIAGQSPHELRLVLTYHVPNAVLEEKRLHAKYARHRRHGEWFDASVITGKGMVRV
jgi:hypothetical protein